MKLIIIIILVVAFIAIPVFLTQNSSVETYESEFSDNGVWGTEFWINFKDGKSERLQFSDAPLQLSIKTWTGLEFESIRYVVKVKVTDLGGFDSVLVKSNSMKIKMKISRGSTEVYSYDYTATPQITIDEEDKSFTLWYVDIPSEWLDGTLNGLDSWGAHSLSFTAWGNKPKYKGNSADTWATGSYPPYRLLLFKHDTDSGQMVMSSVQSLSKSLGGA